MSDNLFILESKLCNSITDFINHWKPLYSYFDDNRYYQNINVVQFNDTNLVDLFHWKNGMTLKGSGGKEKSLNDKILKRVLLINEYKKQSKIELEKFNEDFSDVSPVWRIFLLHIIKPNKYPIYDQHIHRTYNFIHGLEWKSIKNTISDKSKLDFYFKSYLPFVEKLEINSLKEMDEAFFAFGQFLNTRNQGTILTHNNIQF